MHDVSVFYDPYSREVFDDPYPVYKSLRDEAPLYRDPSERWWVLSRFDDVWSAVRDYATFSSRLGPDPANLDDNGRKYSIISMDPSTAPSRRTGSPRRRDSCARSSSPTSTVWSAEPVWTR
jgi:cytochrome P450